MNKRKYPASLFVIGLITNAVFHFFYLFIPALILIFVGIWVKKCLYVGLGLLLLDILLSLIEQLRLRHVSVSDTDNPDFAAFQDALFSGGNWMDNVKGFVEEQINENSKMNDE